MEKTFGICPDWKSLLDLFNSGLAPDIMDLGPLQTHLAMCSSCWKAISETGEEICQSECPVSRINC